ncbi:hypothetical protein [Cryptosporangium phraense]|uniref:Uncharacterized protein n=1 Tax=Cryptosporangium phraense TaxID=2593070 RepID=A0A545ANY6_9ACTN|nr:hypothetical protein [Cryptosporangium phraense]TQS42990.1 hypothetical protein FL583_21365 [Cryptosporangium phraense]
MVHWRSVGRRVLAAVESSFSATVAFPSVPWPDLPTQAWAVGPDGRPRPVPTPMDGGPYSPRS